MKDEDEMEEGEDDEEEEEPKEEPKEPKPKQKKADEIKLPSLDWKEVIAYLEPVLEVASFHLTKGLLTVREMEASQVAMVSLEKIVDYEGEPQAFSVNLADFKQALNAVGNCGVKASVLTLKNNELVVQQGEDSAVIPTLETSMMPKEPALVLNASVSVSSLKDAAAKAAAFSSHLVIESKDGVVRAIANGENGRLNKKVGTALGEPARAMYPLTDYLAKYLKAAGSGTFSFDNEKPCKIERELNDYVRSDEGKGYSMKTIKTGRVAYYLAPRVESN